MNIVIAGGGTAGWLAALFLSRAHSGRHNITLIESTDIGIIGVGEGSTGLFNELILNRFFNTGIDINNFIKEVDATYKTGILHKNWTSVGDSYFAPLDTTLTCGANPDVDFLKTFITEGKEGMHKATELGEAYSKFKIHERSAYHFNGYKIGSYLKNLLKCSVAVIDNTIVKVNLNEQGLISDVQLSNGLIVTGDFFVDCTGFKRVLMNALNVKWESSRKHLPVNSALSFTLPSLINLTKFNTYFNPYTTATALKAGWMWQIPTTERIGCGYIYQSELINAEQAQKEVEQTLGIKIEPTRNIKFESGRSEKMWQGNCLALGLAAAFAEPLEATSIHTIILQLLSFTFEFLTQTQQGTVLESNIRQYNTKMITMYNDITDFLVTHYQGGRDDSEFWKWIKEGNTLTPFVADTLERCKHKVPGVFNYNLYYGSPGLLYNWTLAGIGKITQENAINELKLYNL